MLVGEVYPARVPSASTLSAVSPVPGSVIATNDFQASRP